MGVDTTSRVGEADLRWWLDLAPTLEWIFAKTYAETAPHSYVVHGRSPGLSMEDFIRAGRVIRTFGEPGKFYNSTNLYLYSEDRRYKYWAMWGLDTRRRGRRPHQLRDDGPGLRPAGALRHAASAIADAAPGRRAQLKRQAVIRRVRALSALGGSDISSSCTASSDCLM